MFQSSSYLNRVFESVQTRNSNEPEFLQAVEEVLSTLKVVLDRRPGLEKYGIIERLVEPDRLISFRVSWVDDAGKVQVNRAYRVQFNSSIGPYKGGLRLHPSVNASVIKFLGFEQIFKNALTTLPMGGGKGGCDFDPKGKSDGEVMRFCQSFMTELYRHIGADIDVPAGDIGVGEREIGYMFGQYKRITNSFSGVLTGKGLLFGGSLFRTEATGFGLCYYVDQMLQNMKQTDCENKTVVLSGSGNVAVYAAEKMYQFGSKVVAMSDSNGYIYDKNGVNLDVIKKIKFEERGRISEYVKHVPEAEYVEGCRNIWNIPCEIALPCATQNELDLNSAKTLIKNGVICVAEGANMPCTLDAINAFLENGVLFGPAKAANAGGVACSGLEMSQNSIRYNWTFEKVDDKIQSIMKTIFTDGYQASQEYGVTGNLLMGSNIAGFNKVADAMISQGVI